MNKLIFILPFVLLLASCNQVVDEVEYTLEIPEGLPDLIIPEDNPLTAQKIELGKALFFDPIVSRDFDLSCASCHLPNFAFSDTLAFSVGTDGKFGDRNSPSLLNAAYKPYLFKDGGIKSLELQIFAPLDHVAELNLAYSVLEQRLQNHPRYPALFEEVFGRKPDMYGFIRAIAAYERTLISANSPYDFHFLRGEPTLNSEELLGFDVFKSDSAACIACHSGVFFTNYQFENIGLYSNYPDQGRKKVTQKAEDAGKFVVPTLRNLAKTAPYMHDGSFKTLDAVLLFYESGGNTHPNKSALMKPFKLSQEHREALLAFLKTLNDVEN